MVGSRKCGRVGNNRCIANGHYADCEILPPSCHSIYTECVKCSNQRQIEEQEQSTAPFTTSPASYSD